MAVKHFQDSSQRWLGKKYISLIEVMASLAMGITPNSRFGDDGLISPLRVTPCYLSVKLNQNKQDTNKRQSGKQQQ